MTETVTRKATERVIFDNYNLSEWYDEVYANLTAERDGKAPSDTEVWNVIHDESADDWDEERERLNSFFDCGDDSTWLLVGTCGRWNGSFPGGFTFKNFDEMFRKVSQDCDCWKLWDENGHFYGMCSHHDGTNTFEIKKVSRAGAKFLENWEYFDNKHFSEQELHRKLWDKYCTLPNYAHIVYGAKKVEYDKKPAKGVV